MAKVDKNPRRGYHTLQVEGVGEVNLLFTMRFWAFLEEAGYKLEDLDGKISGGAGVVEQLKAIAAIIWSAGHTYDRRHDSDFTYTQDDIFDWLEEDVTEKDLTKMIEAMMSTKIFGNSINKNIDRLGKPEPPQKMKVE